MYNKIFTKILDSSIWLEPTPTRIVWITLIVAMDEHGFCPFAAVGNVAGRARVTIDEARIALASLEAPDPESSDPENDGRRLERVPGGWIVCNAPKYRQIVTRVEEQNRARERQRKHRAGLTNGNGSSHSVTDCHEDVTQSEAGTEAFAFAGTEAFAETEAEAPVVSVEKGKEAPRSGLPNGGRSPAEGSSLHDDAEMIATAVIEGTGVTSRWVRNDLVLQAEIELKQHPGDMNGIRDGMIAAWKAYQQCAKADKLRTSPMSAERFFGEGKWKTTSMWALKKGKRAYE